jgi:hypothetical protein
VKREAYLVKRIPKYERRDTNDEENRGGEPAIAAEALMNHVG